MTSMVRRSMAGAEPAGLGEWCCDINGFHLWARLGGRRECGA
jgi:hypothetical protein